MILHDLFLSGVLFKVPFAVLIKDYVFSLEPLLGVVITLVKGLQSLRYRLVIVEYQRLSMDVRRRQLIIGVFAVDFLLLQSMFLEVVFLFGVVKLAVDRIVVMRLGVFLVDVVGFFVDFLLNFLLMVLLVDVVDYVKVPMVVLKELFGSFLRQSDVPVLKKELWKFLIVNHVEGVTDGTQLTRRRLRIKRKIRLQVYDIEVFLILGSLTLH